MTLTLFLTNSASSEQVEQSLQRLIRSLAL
jgi:hypothetical protein